MAPLLIAMILATAPAEPPYCTLQSQSPLLSKSLFQQLTDCGLRLLFPRASLAHLNPEREELYPIEDVDLRISDFNQKEKIFRKWLRLSPIQPSKRVILEIDKKKGSRSTPF